MQITDIFRVPGRGLVALWFAGNYHETDAHKCWGEIVSTDNGRTWTQRTIAKDLTKDRVRRGEMLFNDGSMCFQQWQSCATCHPSGRTDGYEWAFPNADGLGKPELTCDLGGVDMEHSARKGRMATDIEIALFAMPEKDKVAAMQEYVKSIPKTFCQEK